MSAGLKNTAVVGMCLLNTAEPRKPVRFELVAVQKTAAGGVVTAPAGKTHNFAAGAGAAGTGRSKRGTD